MKTTEDLQKNDPHANSKESLLNPSRLAVTDKVSKHFRRFIFSICLIGIGLLFNSCMGGYIATEPVYVENNRPPRPSNLHIWIDGDWIWSSQSHNYVHQNGYWEQPRENRTYVAGYWQTTSRGKNWKSGHWQRNDNRGGNRHR
jgi:hypothetical protein